MIRAAPPLTTDGIAGEIDHARSRGPLQQIVIPPCPALLTRLQQALALAEPDLGEVARIASSDVAMSAVLIRQASGAQFAGFAPAQTVGQAMTRLGLTQTAALMTGFLARQSIRADSPHLQGFWERSGQRAVVLDGLARQMPDLSPDLAHTFGLFLHVGMPVLLQSFRSYAGTIVEGQARRDRTFVQTENANHRTDHAVVGALVARVWRLAPTVMGAIRLHHDLASLGDSSIEPEVHTLVAAGLVAEHLLRRHQGLDAEADWVQHGAQALAWLHAGPEDLQDWEHTLLPLLEAA
ncbi:MAG: HDOD domain-containing protein [Rubrivivax sp.]|nr:HDOD domain-containing protein [Rubrivivax sp.]